MKHFDGRAIRDKILEDIKLKIEKEKLNPVLAVVLVGENAVGESYVKLKAKFAYKIGVKSEIFRYDGTEDKEIILNKIKELNQDPKISGIMIQMPVPDEYDKIDLVNAISPEKDVDGLRFCGGFRSLFHPPVVLAILKAIEESGKQIENSHVVVVGRGFLVGWPLAQCLEEEVKGLVVVDNNTKNLHEITKSADILISATGTANLIKPEMVKEGVVLIDAGTTEINGELAGDIDPETFSKASFYTPVPGGIGPVTVAMLMRNLVESINL
jgi:methylenetetrahydrofolate dehydrogenase (NADP+)/methenyltetrahydrofolate cyclohydrolase